MKNLRLFLVLSGSALLSLTSSIANAGWSLNESASSFYYVTSKASAISEVNSFSGLSGSIADSGNASLNIDLSTVNTNIDVRDQRMRDIVFQISEFAQAEITVAVDVQALESMNAGMSTAGSYTVSLNLHGISQELIAELQVSKAAGNVIMVQTAMPLIINAGSFALLEGVEELRELAGLPSINPNVVVNFSLVFEQD